MSDGNLFEKLGNGNAKINGVYRLYVTVISTFATGAMGLFIWLGLQVWADVREARDGVRAQQVINLQQASIVKQITDQLTKQSEALDALAQRMAHMEGCCGNTNR